MALRGRQSGVDLKPPQAAVVKSNGGERCGNAGTGFRQARLREASASEPSMKCRKRIRRCQNRGLTLRIDSHRLGNILERLHAAILEWISKLRPHMLVHSGGDADADGLCQRFEARGYVDSVPVDILVSGDDVTEINADP